jgi:hypothetical protein
MYVPDYEQTNRIPISVFFLHFLGKEVGALWRGKNAIGGGNFITSQMRRNEKESSAYFNISLITIRFTVVRLGLGQVSEYSDNHGSK